MARITRASLVLLLSAFLLTACATALRSPHVSELQ